MKKYIAFVRGHYQQLGFEEFYATLEAERINYEVTRIKEQTVFFTSKDDPVIAAQRCAFLHSIIGIIAIGRIEGKNLNIEILEDDFKLIPEAYFCVRVRRIGKKEIEIKSTEIEKELAKYVFDLFEKYNLKVDLKNPIHNFVALSIKDELFFGLEMWSSDRKSYREREPAVRPNFRPGSMKTDYARALVNLSRIRKDEVFLDPFCGSGGILIEASLLGANCIGTDIDYNAAVSSNQNVKAFSNGFFSILIGDSRYLPIKHVQGIATDPPYSIQSSTHGEELEILIQAFLKDSESILSKNRYLVFSSPSKIEPEKLIEKTNFEIVSMIDTRIHKSLTRRILVVK